MNEIKFMPFPALTAGHLFLRQLTMNDANEIFELRSNASVNEFLDRPKAQTIDDAYQFIERINDGISKNASILWAVSSESDATLLGTICLWKISWEQKEAEIGYELLPVNQGKGIMQEVIPKIIEYAFSVMQLRSINAELSPHNIKSVNLLEKYGFEKISGDEKGATVIYTLTNKGA
jgi:ribosomal-protein-alanine N-acetyltransferase